MLAATCGVVLMQGAAQGINVEGKETDSQREKAKELK